MAFREVIEAVLKVKDANRFKAGMDKAARAVRKFGHDEEAAAAQTELLKEISDRLEKQSYQLSAALTVVAHSVDELGDEMLQTAAKAQVMNVAMKKSGSNAVFLGKSWAFWKDRLSLTRSEIITTALTIGAYFSPAIIAMGSSFAYAAIGGGGVALGGLSTFIFGLVALSTVIKPVTEGIKKVQKAQEQYNLAVEQYGANSLQASRASAHLYGIVMTQGGKPIADATENIAKLGKEWKKATAPARGRIVGTLNAGLDATRTVMPTLSSGTNQIAQAVETAMNDVFKVLSGNEMRQNFRSIFQIFEKAIGPGLRGFANIILIIGRIIRATGPWIVKWAAAWERTTMSWRRGTRDSAKLSSFFDGAVKHFKAWWRLAKALGNTLKIIFGASKDEGLTVVNTLTDLVEKFNDWLTMAKDTGKIDEFWRKYNQSVRDAVWALQNPVQAINKWLPRVMDAIATTLATHAPAAARVFIKAFLDSGSWAQLLTVAWAMKKFGFFKAVGGRVAGVFLVPFLAKFGEGFAAAIGGEALAGSLGSKISNASGTAGKGAGKVFGKMFVVGVAAALIIFGPDLRKAMSDMVPDPFKPLFAGPEDIFNQIVHPGRKKSKERNKEFEDTIKSLLPDFKLPHKAAGGTIPPGGSAIVGESGMELAHAGQLGTNITPISGASRPEIPNLEGAMRLTVHSHIHVEKREIARAVADEAAYSASRRGGLKLRPNG